MYNSQLPWHLGGANAIKGRGPSFIGAIQGKIVVDQYDLKKLNWMMEYKTW